MHPSIESALAEAHQVDARLRRALAKTPDDRLNWSPSPTARSPLGLVAHCAFALGFIRQMFAGTPYPATTTAQADEEFLAMEQGITTREDALSLWEDRFGAFVSHLESIPDEDHARAITLPFGLGEAPLGAILGVGAAHTREHLAQLDYLQTVWEDRAW